MMARARITAGLFGLTALAALAADPPALPDADPHYRQVLQAYRGKLTPEELDKLGETDPAPTLFIGSRIPALRSLVRFFAALPDAAHATLQRDGLLKWRLDRLPSDQRKNLEKLVEHLENEGLGPYPTRGRGAAHTGFVRLVLEDEKLTGPVYSWWIDAEKARVPAWIPLVRASGLGGAEYTAAIRARLTEARDEPAAEPPPGGDWLRLAEPALPGPPPKETGPAGRLLRAFRKGGGTASHDALVLAHLTSRQPADRAIVRFVSGLSRDEERRLEEEGNLRWFPQDLSADRRRLLQPVLDRLAAQSPGIPPHSLAPGGSRMGICGILVPEVEQPVFVWWIRAPGQSLPAWIALNNPAAVARPEFTGVVLRVVGAF